MLQLVSMDLSGNQLSGSLPDSWSGTSSLAYMNISSNRLSGPLLSSWSNLAQVWDCPLQCCIPAVYLPRAIMPLRRELMLTQESDLNALL